MSASARKEAAVPDPKKTIEEVLDEFLEAVG